MTNRTAGPLVSASAAGPRSVWEELSDFLNRQQALGLRGVETPPLWGTRPATLPKVSSPFEPMEVSSPKTRAWPELRRAIGACAACRLHEGRTGAVLGRGSEQAALMFFGEAPSRDDDLQGEAFVGSPGALLSKMVAAMGVDPDNVYIGHTVACRPPRNRAVRPDERGACRDFLSNQIALVQPRIIIALGEGASQALFASSASLDELRGTWTTFLGFPVVSTYHPQMLLDAPAKKRLCWQDLQVVMARLAAAAPPGEVQT